MLLNEVLKSIYVLCNLGIHTIKIITGSVAKIVNYYSETLFVDLTNLANSSY